MRRCALWLVLASSGCGGGDHGIELRVQDPSGGEVTVAETPQASPVPPPRVPGPPTREEMNRVVAAGLGALLARVQVTPVFDGARFVGYRLDGAADLETWHGAGADVRVGDIIVRVNGVRIERPEQAMWAFEQLRIVPAVAVELIRASLPVSVRVPIVETTVQNARN